MIKPQNIRFTVDCRRHARAERGLSLVELLVVIAVIAIIAAILLPVVGSAKNQSAKATDLSNLHQIMMAEHVYLGDNQDVLTWPNWDYGGAMPNGVARPGWLYTINLSATSTTRFNAKAGLLWDSLHGGKSLLCPMDNPGEVYQNSNGKPSYRAMQLSSYIMNGAVMGFRTGYHSNSIPVRASQMLPGDCILFEADDSEAFSFNDGSSWPSEGISKRHSNGATFAALDGSSSYVRDDDWSDDVDYPNRNRLWCYPLSDDGGDSVYGHVIPNE